MNDRISVRRLDAYTQVVRTSATLLTSLVGPTLRHSGPDLEQMLIATEIAAFYASESAAGAFIAAADAGPRPAARPDWRLLDVVREQSSGADSDRAVFAPSSWPGPKTPVACQRLARLDQLFNGNDAGSQSTRSGPTTYDSR